MDQGYNEIGIKWDRNRVDWDKDKDRIWNGIEGEILDIGSSTRVAIDLI